MLIFANGEDKEHCAAHIKRGEPGCMTRVVGPAAETTTVLINVLSAHKTRKISERSILVLSTTHNIKIWLCIRLAL
jgi:hypothetical protein